ncbi:hypothetical protein BDF20DRAFT_983565 [Mycotypha africana]|uniref:uncharacterized protein n=1 Tax=Mycotypha africana TaxID=64632 RepID=UPI0023016E09|nr:uncharacterized protein BDF20DRAFT_983565 [Mycotypha africana]KAI8990791.1 hypothetical protein BDF20DRAFT_983565 [Mycotypha africana]
MVNNIKQRIAKTIESVSQELRDISLQYLEEKGFEVAHRAAGLELQHVDHACGHNLIAITGLACAISLKTLLEKNLVQGTVVLYGTPAEEIFNGKIPFSKERFFKEQVDYCMLLKKVEAAKTESAHQHTLRAAKCMSMTAAEVLINDEFYEKLVSNYLKSMELRGEAVITQL